MNDMPMIVKINRNHRYIPALLQFIGFYLIKRAQLGVVNNFICCRKYYPATEFTIKKSSITRVQPSPVKLQHKSPSVAAGFCNRQTSAFR